MAKPKIPIKIISAILALVFTADSACYGLATLPAAQNIPVKREIFAALQRTQIRYAESEEALGLLRANNARCLLLSSGKYLVSKELADPGNETDLLASIRHEETEALMQIVAAKDPRRYAAMRELVLKVVPPAFRDDQFADLHVNHTLASIFQWLSLVREGIISRDEIPAAYRSLMVTLEPVLNANRHTYFTEEFWDPGARAAAIRKARNAGFCFYRTANAYSDIDESILRAVREKTDIAWDEIVKLEREGKMMRKVGDSDALFRPDRKTFKARFGVSEVVFIPHDSEVYAAAARIREDISAALPGRVYFNTNLHMTIQGIQTDQSEPLSVPDLAQILAGTAQIPLIPAGTRYYVTGVYTGTHGAICFEVVPVPVAGEDVLNGRRRAWQEIYRKTAKKSMSPLHITLGLLNGDLTADELSRLAACLAPYRHRVIGSCTVDRLSIVHHYNNSLDTYDTLYEADLAEGRVTAADPRDAARNAPPSEEATDMRFVLKDHRDLQIVRQNPERWRELDGGRFTNRLAIFGEEDHLITDTDLVTIIHSPRSSELRVYFHPAALTQRTPIPAGGIFIRVALGKDLAITGYHYSPYVTESMDLAGVLEEAGVKSHFPFLYRALVDDFKARFDAKALPPDTSLETLIRIFATGGEETRDALGARLIAQLEGRLLPFLGGDRPGRDRIAAIEPLDRGNYAHPLLITTASDQKYVLKKNELRVDEEMLRYQDSLLDRLTRNGVPSVPRPIHDASGRYYIDDDGSFFCLYSYIEGHSVKQNEVDPDQIGEAAAVLARIHRATKDFIPDGQPVGPPALPVLDFNDLSRAKGELASMADELRAINYMSEPALGELKTRFLASVGLFMDQTDILDRNLKDIGMSNLARCVIHGNFRPPNTVFDDTGRIAGVIDWDYARADLRVFDLANKFLDLRHYDRLFVQLGQFLQIYQREAGDFRLNEAEIRALKEMVRAKLIEDALFWGRKLLCHIPQSVSSTESLRTALETIDEQKGWERLAASSDRRNRKSEEGDTNLSRGVIDETGETHPALEKAANDGRMFAVLTDQMAGRPLDAFTDEELAGVFTGNLLNLRAPPGTKAAILARLRDPAFKATLLKGFTLMREAAGERLPGAHSIRLCIIVEEGDRPTIVYRDTDNNLVAHTGRGRKTGTPYLSIYAGFHALETARSLNRPADFSALIKHEARDAQWGHESGYVEPLLDRFYSDVLMACFPGSDGAREIGRYIAMQAHPLAVKRLLLGNMRLIDRVVRTVATAPADIDRTANALAEAVKRLVENAPAYSAFHDESAHYPVYKVYRHEVDLSRFLRALPAIAGLCRTPALLQAALGIEAAFGPLGVEHEKSVYKTHQGGWRDQSCPDYQADPDREVYLVDIAIGSVIPALVRGLGKRAARGVIAHLGAVLQGHAGDEMRKALERRPPAETLAHIAAFLKGAPSAGVAEIIAAIATGNSCGVRKDLLGSSGPGKAAVSPPSAAASPVKCLVLDADGVLWKGVIDEDGIAGVTVTPAHRALQEKVKALKERGVLLAINSRNSPADIEEALDRVPGMVLRRDDFVVVRAGWGDKAAGMSDLISDLGIGADTVVFMDDDPRERASMAARHPTVIIPEEASDPAGSIAFLERLGDTLSSAATATDARRTLLTAAGFERKKLFADAPSSEEYLRALATKIVMREGKENRPLIDRIAQLTQRTNHFNTTMKRYAEADIGRMLDDPSCRVFTLERRDAVWADEDIIGVLIIRTTGAGKADIDTFCLSCRTGPDEILDIVARTFLGYASESLRLSGVSSLFGGYVPGERNAFTADLYRRLGFRVSIGTERPWVHLTADGLSPSAFIERVASFTEGRAHAAAPAPVPPDAKTFSARRDAADAFQAAFKTGFRSYHAIDGRDTIKAIEYGKVVSFLPRLQEICSDPDMLEKALAVEIALGGLGLHGTVLGTEYYHCDDADVDVATYTLHFEFYSVLEQLLDVVKSDEALAGFIKTWGAFCKTNNEYLNATIRSLTSHGPEANGNLPSAFRRSPGQQEAILREIAEQGLLGIRLDRTPEHPAFAFEHLPDGPFSAGRYCMTSGATREQADKTLHILLELGLVSVRVDGYSTYTPIPMDAVKRAKIGQLLRAYSSGWRSIANLREKIKKVMAENSEDAASAAQTSFDAEQAVVLGFDLIHDQLQERRTYAVRYDEARLSLSQRGLIKRYIELLQKKSSARIVARPFSGADGSGKALVSVTCEGDNFNGTGEVDVAVSGGALGDNLLRVVGLVNIALASSNIPKNFSELPRPEREKYLPLIGYIGKQCASITGQAYPLPDDPAELAKAVHRITLRLPPAVRLSIDVIERYNALALQALIAA